jgi:hypothetical protein
MATQNIGDGLLWFVAKVEDINDPQKVGRVKIRIFNEHDDPTLETKDLLWATPLMPVTSACHGQVGRSPTGLLVDSVVFGFFLDNQERQLPIIWGTYAKVPGGDQKNNDVPPLAREINSINKIQDGPEPPSAYGAKYPYNHVTQTQSGHVIEIDDTPSKERLHVYHKSGTYIEVNFEGQRVTKVVGDDIEVVIKDKTVYVKGNASIKIDGNLDITAGGNINMTAGGKMNLKGSKISLN